ncbi:hypothetical protein L2E82_06662 [Cichorium intybus]|uniref:Uncharacterized protein n=1 Tax=Cichorium intybus TaxID=13427 RepID=A0ACB9HAN6_CICIN|nr:hypothetical protein L2E82_06662 [Cichorium intybus]
MPPSATSCFLRLILSFDSSDYKHKRRFIKTLDPQIIESRSGKASDTDTEGKIPTPGSNFFRSTSPFEFDRTPGTDNVVKNDFNVGIKAQVATVEQAGVEATQYPISKHEEEGVMQAGGISGSLSFDGLMTKEDVQMSRSVLSTFKAKEEEIEKKKLEENVIEPANAFRIPAGCFARDCRLLFYSRSFVILCNKITRRNNLSKNRIRAAAEELSGPVKQAKPQRYRPSEGISESEESDENGDAILGSAETSRTVIEVNNKAMIMFSGLLGDGVHENIFSPDLPYVTDEHGNIYFQVKNDEDILQTLTSEDTLVQLILGLDTTEMEWVSLLQDEEDDEDSDGMDAMKIHNQISGYEGFQQLNEIPMSIEETIFLAATTQIQLDNFKSGRFHTMITSAFSLIEVAHIISNMIGLYFFCMLEELDALTPSSLFDWRRWSGTANFLRSYPRTRFRILGLYVKLEIRNNMNDANSDEGLEVTVHRHDSPNNPLSSHIWFASFVFLTVTHHHQFLLFSPER